MSKSDFEKFLKTGETRWNPLFGPDDPCTAQDYLSLARVYWETGCHAEVPCRPPEAQERLGPRLVKGPSMEWRRPKTKLECRMPISSQSEVFLSSWLPRRVKPHPDTVSRNFTAIGRLAGLGDVTCKTFRYSRAWAVYKAAGPHQAKASLGVSDRMLAHYVRLDELDATEALRGVL